MSTVAWVCEVDGASHLSRAHMLCRLCAGMHKGWAGWEACGLFWALPGPCIMHAARFILDLGKFAV